jgi:hypothetical protein
MYCTNYLDCLRLLASEKVLCCTDCVTYRCCYHCVLVVCQGVEPIVL